MEPYDEFLDEISLNEAIEYLVETISIYVSEFEYELNLECTITLPEDIEKEIM